MTPRRYELTDFEWSIIQPLLPNKPRGVARVDDRRVLNGIYWRLRSGSPWAEIPERYGPATTCYNRFIRWRKLGIWDKIFDAVSKAYDGDTLRTSKRGAANPGRARRSSPMHGAFTRRTDDQDPCAGRWQWLADRPQADRGSSA